ncbi:hypothetical protein PENANT_c010G06397 [Penicillium antarcticum]|uniref:Uncharacterized protein n=1 Tax=Penicillium antarcticum TaxID=416450 RepID=A0A1V6Q7V6_9EURO|nr:hypothetical protein PENANT_c010G06397 [Penicillium antarcticum]
MSAISCLTLIDPPAHRACEITTGRPWMSFLSSEAQCLRSLPPTPPFEESVLAVHQAFAMSIRRTAEGLRHLPGVLRIAICNGFEAKG